MDQDKRLTIINEILYWKKNKLLPEQYCDFLLNLYGSPGETAATGSSAILKPSENSSKGKSVLWLATIGMIAIISVVGINFTAFPFPMQITSGVIVVLLLLVFGVAMLGRHMILATISLGLGCFMMLIAGEWILMSTGLDSPAWAVGYLAICCIIWLILGIILRLGYLQFCGWMGLFIVYGWLLANRLDPLYSLQLQVAWIALAALFFWSGWLVKGRQRSVTRVLWMMGILTLVAPELEVYAFAMASSYGPQIVLLGKIILIGIILYVTRKRWTEWVV